VLLKITLHTLLSLSLLAIAEYLTLMVLQIMATALFGEKKLFIYLLYIPMIFLILVKIFSSEIYTLYFFNLLIFLYYLCKTQNILTIKELLLFILYLGFMSIVYLNMDEYIYELTLFLDINENIIYLNSEVTYFLICIHIIILLFMSYNRKKLFRIERCI